MFGWGWSCSISALGNKYLTVEVTEERDEHVCNMPFVNMPSFNWINPDLSIEWPFNCIHGKFKGTSLFFCILFVKLEYLDLLSSCYITVTIFALLCRFGGEHWWNIREQGKLAHMGCMYTWPGLSTFNFFFLTWCCSHWKYFLFFSLHKSGFAEIIHCFCYADLLKPLQLPPVWQRVHEAGFMYLASKHCGLGLHAVLRVEWTANWGGTFLHTSWVSSKSCRETQGRGRSHRGGQKRGNHPILRLWTEHCCFFASQM